MSEPTTAACADCAKPQSEPGVPAICAAWHQPAVAAPKYGEPTPDPLDEAWREFILTVGRTLHLDRVMAWLSRRLGADRDA